MSESRYAAGLTDPDETTRIPGDALEGLRDGEAGREKAGGAPSGDGSRNGSTASGPAGSPPAAAGSGGGTGPGTSGRGSAVMPPRTPFSPGMNGHPSDGAPAAASGPSPASVPSVYGSGSTAAGSRPVESGPGASEPPAASGSGGSGFSGSGFGERSDSPYAPSSYSGSYGGAYQSLGEPPTTVAGGTSGARTALGAAAGVGSATGSRPVPGARPSPRGGTAGRPPRRARLLVRHIDPWSTLKFSFVLAVAMFFVWLVAVGVLYGVLDSMSVFEQLNSLYGEVSGTTGDQLFSPGLVLGTAALVGAVNIVLFTALATIGAFVYNICSDLVGGIEVTLAERD